MSIEDPGEPVRRRYRPRLVRAGSARIAPGPRARPPERPHALALHERPACVIAEDELTWRCRTSACPRERRRDRLALPAKPRLGHAAGPAHLGRRRAREIEAAGDAVDRLRAVPRD